MFAIFLLIVCFLSSSDPLHGNNIPASHYIEEAKKAVKRNDLLLGIEIYSAAIAATPKQHEKERIILHGNRGILHLAIENYQEALSDFKKIPYSFDTDDWEQKSEILSGLCGRILALYVMNIENELNEEIAKLAYTIISMQNELHNITWLKENPMCQKNINHLHAKIFKQKSDARLQLIDFSNVTPEESCVLQCQAYGVAAAWACNRIPNPAIQLACIGSIFGLEKVCCKCCEGEGFWKNCVNPLRRLFHDPEHPKNPAPHPYE
jgi:tetratricopeptide (TPR) repeat protein